MPKLLQINVTANWGSTGKIAEQINDLATLHGWDCYIAYGRYKNPSKSKLIKVGGRFNPYLHYTQQFFFDNEGLNSICQTRQLIKKVRKIDPDIVHLHNIHDHWINYRILFEYLNSTNIKVVWTFHDCWAFTGHCMHFENVSCVKWRTECKDCPQRNIFYDASNRNFNIKRFLFSGGNLTIVPVSNWLGSYVKESFLKDKRVIVIHNGIDLNIFKPSIQRKNHDGFKILAVSSVWHEFKGLYDIYKLREMLPPEYNIMIVGLSDKQLKEIPKGIDGIMRTQNVQELVNLYSNTDVFINPTYADTFPTVNIEALACGTPVITYKTGGSPEAIDEKTGVVVEQGDINALAKAVQQMKITPFSSESCRQRAVEYFDKDKCFAKYIDLYNELINI